MRNIADVTGGKPIAVLLQSISGVSVITPLVAFYDIHGGKARCYSFILSRTPHETIKLRVYLKHFFTIPNHHPGIWKWLYSSLWGVFTCQFVTVIHSPRLFWNFNNNTRQSLKLQRVIKYLEWIWLLTGLIFIPLCKINNDGKSPTAY
jgi:hypothetical protein